MIEKDIEILIKSLKMIAGFSEHIYYVAYSWEYLRIHHRNLHMLNELSEERNSTYISNKIKEYPEIRTEEIDFFIAEQRGENINKGNLFNFIFNFINHRKFTKKSYIENKISKISSLNLHLVKIIENPFLEELYLKESSLSK